MGSIWLHQGGTVRIYRGTVERKATFHVGLFATERMREVGGYNPAERIGQDTVLLRLLSRSGPYLRFDPTNPTYHRNKHPGSLTTAAMTNHRSDARRAVKRRNRELFTALAGLPPTSVRGYRESIVPPAIREDLACHVDRLSALLGKAVAA